MQQFQQQPTVEETMETTEIPRLPQADQISHDQILHELMQGITIVPLEEDREKMARLMEAWQTAS
jgi:hypothetical protein